MFNEKLSSTRDFLDHRNKISSVHITADHSRRSWTFHNWIIKAIHRSEFSAVTNLIYYVCIVLFNVHRMSIRTARSECKWVLSLNSRLWLIIFGRECTMSAVGPFFKERRKEHLFSFWKYSGHLNLFRAWWEFWKATWEFGRRPKKPALEGNLANPVNISKAKPKAYVTFIHAHSFNTRFRTYR